MTTKPDSVYYAERLAAELKALETATNPVARRAHDELAKHYADLLAAGDPQPASPAIVSETSVN